jgi:hypothetical protein
MLLRVLCVTSEERVVCRYASRQPFHAKCTARSMKSLSEDLLENTFEMLVPFLPVSGT